MRQQVDRLARLAEDLLDLTRLDAGRLHFERYPVDLAELARDLVDEFRAVALASGHPLEAVAEPAEAFGDEERVRRIGRALIENALRHTRRGRRSGFAPRRPRSTTLPSWSRTRAAGSPTSTRATCSTASTAPTAGLASGSGLGLAIAQELAEAMGGTLELHSHPATRRSRCASRRRPPRRFHGKTPPRRRARPPGAMATVAGGALPRLARPRRGRRCRPRRGGALLGAARPAGSARARRRPSSPRPPISPRRRPSRHPPAGERPLRRGRDLRPALERRRHDLRPVAGGGQSTQGSGFVVSPDG